MKTVFIALVTFLLSTAALAEVSAQGKVDDINYKERTIVIDDQFYRLAKNLQVTGADGKKTTIFAIKKGGYVSGKFLTGKSAQKTIFEMRISNAVIISDDEETSESDG